METEEALRHAISMKPKSAGAYFSLGIILEEQNRLVEARDVLERGLRLEERQPILNILGEVQRRLGDLEAAEASYRQSVELNPSDDEAHYGLGVVLKDCKPEEAVRHLREAIRIESNAQALRELGYALWRSNKNAEAETTLRQAVNAEPGDAWAHTYLGYLLGLRGAWTEAYEEFAASTRASPEIALFWLNLADASWRLGRAEEAERHYLHALSLDTSDSLPALRYGLFLKRRGEIAKARTYLERALRLDPDEDRAQKALTELTRS